MWFRLHMITHSHALYIYGERERGAHTERVMQGVGTIYLSVIVDVGLRQLYLLMYF